MFKHTKKFIDILVKLIVQINVQIFLYFALFIKTNHVFDIAFGKAIMNQFGSMNLHKNLHETEGILF